MHNNITQYDYERISFRPDSNHDSFKIVTGEWSGTVITYGEVLVTEPLDNEEPILKFQYQIEETPLDFTVLENNPDFNNHLGEILKNIIETALQENNFAIGEQPDGIESTNNNFKESN